jgi:hypothetical protein
MPKTIKEEEIVERWSVLIDGAEGRGKELMRRTEELLKEIEAPEVFTEWKEVSPAFFREKRTCLLIRNKKLADYIMYLSARDYGKQLSVFWYLTIESPLWRKLIARFGIFAFPFVPLVMVYDFLKGRGKTSPLRMNLFDLEELTAYVSTGHHAVRDAAKEISQSVGFDFTKVDTKSRGFLNIS